MSRVKFDAAKKEQFLSLYATNGRIYQCALAVGVSGPTVHHHIKDDPEFAERVQSAKGLFKDSIEQEIQRRAMDGVAEPVFSHRSGEQIGTVIKFSDRLLEVFAKRHIDEYRDKHQVDMNVKGGVMVVGKRGKDADAWANDHGEDQHHGSED